MLDTPRLLRRKENPAEGVTGFAKVIGNVESGKVVNYVNISQFLGVKEKD